jgi:diacylglycerol kinase
MIRDNKRKSWLAGRINGFRYAIQGLGTIAGSQQNFKIHLIVAALVLSAGLYSGLSGIEWCIIFLTIGMVLSLEAINTALEYFTDLLSPEYSEKAGKVKDIAAGAVLIAAITSVCVGLIIFGPRIFILF